MRTTVPVPAGCWGADFRGAGARALAKQNRLHASVAGCVCQGILLVCVFCQLHGPLLTVYFTSVVQYALYIFNPCILHTSCLFVLLVLYVLYSVCS